MLFALSADVHVFVAGGRRGGLCERRSCVCWSCALLELCPAGHSQMQAAPANPLQGTDEPHSPKPRRWHLGINTFEKGENTVRQ